MIPYNISFGFNEGTTKFNSTLENDLHDAAAAGFNGIEIRLDKLEEYLTLKTMDDLTARLTQGRLAVYPLNAVKDFNSPDEQTRNDSLRRFEAACEHSRRLGAPAVVVVPCTMDMTVPLSWDDVRRISSRALQSMEVIAARYGTLVALEPVGLTGSSIRSVAQAVEIITAAGGGSGLLLDTFNVYADPEWRQFRLPENISVHGIHVADADSTPLDCLSQENRLWPGEGVIPLCEMLRMFTVHGYRGPLTVELFRPEYYRLPATEVVYRSMDALRAVVEICTEQGAENGTNTDNR